jgi:hypothetical protein
VLKMAETVLKNSHITAKDIWIIHGNFIAIAIKFSGKKLEVLCSYRPSQFILLVTSHYITVIPSFIEIKNVSATDFLLNWAWNNAPVFVYNVVRPLRKRSQQRTENSASQKRAAK